MAKTTFTKLIPSVFITAGFLISFTAKANIVPTLLNKSQRENLMPYFSTAYPQLVTTRPYFLGNYPGLEMGASISYQGLSDIQDTYPTDDIRNEYILTQIFIKKSLVHRLELTVSSTVASFGTTQVSGFGGMLSWHPFNLSDFSILPFVGLYTNVMNYEDTLNFQETGFLLKVAKNFKYFSISSGMNLTQFSGRFSGVSNGRQITASGNDEKESLFNQTYFISTHIDWGKYFLSFSQNYTINGGWHPTIVVSYQF